MLHFGCHFSDNAWHNYVWMQNVEKCQGPIHSFANHNVKSVWSTDWLSITPQLSIFRQPIDTLSHSTEYGIISQKRLKSIR